MVPLKYFHRKSLRRTLKLPFASVKFLALLLNGLTYRQTELQRNDRQYPLALPKPVNSLYLLGGLQVKIWSNVQKCSTKSTIINYPISRLSRLGGIGYHRQIIAVGGEEETYALRQICVLNDRIIDCC